MIVSTPYLHMSEYLKLIYSEFPDICTSLICLNIRTMVNFQALITNHTYVWKIHSLIKFFSRQMENIGKFGILVRLPDAMLQLYEKPLYRGFSSTHIAALMHRENMPATNRQFASLGLRG